MTTPAKLPSRQILQRLWCARCRQRLTPEHSASEARSYQCSNGCRRAPVDGAWLETQLAQAIDGRVPEAMIPYVIDGFTVGDQAPGGVKVWWTPRFPAKPQPFTSSRPTSMFVPVPHTSAPRDRPDGAGIPAAEVRS